MGLKKNGDKVAVAVQITKEQDAALRKLADDMCISYAAAVRVALKQWMTATQGKDDGDVGR